MIWAQAGESLDASGEKIFLMEALIKVRLKNRICSLPLGGPGRGASYGKGKVKLLVCAGLRSGREFFVSTRSCILP